MKVVITGATGQLGQALRRSLPRQISGEPVDIITTARKSGLGDLTLDMADPSACRELVKQCRPDWLINAGAYTAVDQAETQPDLARAVNVGAPKAFAEELQRTGGCLLHLSTDFVFNGNQGSPYRPDQPVDPLNVYGLTKAAGETAVASVLSADQLCILRTSWLYGPKGKNFLLTMLRLMREREQLAVVSDQVGCPTATSGLAQACWAVIEHQVSGLHHWSDAGVASWYDFAVAIADLARKAGALHNYVRIDPICTTDYPTPAQRPSYSLLDCTRTREALHLSSLHWREALEKVLDDVVA